MANGIPGGLILADGDARLSGWPYWAPHFNPPGEWDTGAAQCVLEAAGGGVTDTAGRRLVYNKEQILNPSFLAFGDPRQDWLALLEGRGA